MVKAFTQCKTLELFTIIPAAGRSQLPLLLKLTKDQQGPLSAMICQLDACHRCAELAGLLVQEQNSYRQRDPKPWCATVRAKAERTSLTRVLSVRW